MINLFYVIYYRAGKAQREAVSISGPPSRAPYGSRMPRNHHHHHLEDHVMGSRSHSPHSPSPPYGMTDGAGGGGGGSSALLSEQQAQLHHGQGAILGLVEVYARGWAGNHLGVLLLLRRGHSLCGMVGVLPALIRG